MRESAMAIPDKTAAIGEPALNLTPAQRNRFQFTAPLFSPKEIFFNFTITRPLFFTFFVFAEFLLSFLGAQGFVLYLVVLNCSQSDTMTNSLVRKAVVGGMKTRYCVSRSLAGQIIKSKTYRQYDPSFDNGICKTSVKAVKVNVKGQRKIGMRSKDKSL